MITRFLKRTFESDSAQTLYFEKPATLQYEPGQFIELSLHHRSPDSRGTRRWFTLSSSPTEKHLSITTRISKDGSSFKSALNQLKPRQKINISMPMGDFVLPKDQTLPLYFVACGLGLTPMRSMVKSLQDNNEHWKIKLIYSLGKGEEFIFKSLFDSYCHDVIVMEEHLTAPKVFNFIEESNCLIYVAGPEQMVEVVIPGLESLGIAQSRLVGDYFPGY
jgi:glycine betaine catabolism B